MYKVGRRCFFLFREEIFFAIPFVARKVRHFPLYISHTFFCPSFIEGIGLYSLGEKRLMFILARVGANATREQVRKSKRPRARAHACTTLVSLSLSLSLDILSIYLSEDFHLPSALVHIAVRWVYEHVKWGRVKGREGGIRASFSSLRHRLFT